MLEPLIVLTVLNCFFMFSSTVTTCALWWQYRTHRCCFKKDPLSAKYNLSKSKNNNNNNNNNNNSSKKTVHLKHDNGANLVTRSKSNSTVNRESKSRRSSKQKSKSNARHQSRSKTPSDERLPSIDMMESWDLENRTRMSEASQTANGDPKSAMVMEYSTMQKIVQIIDNDTDLAATKMAMRDLGGRRKAEERKDSMIESQFEPQPVSDYTPGVM
ncbi:putative mediator of RNA polymerase II transcription subunit 29 [Frieseomelitta varia]|uniref:putative mediator of RNA polymerase II transcription subunit 29 n=1 Tax=Frieseomelitta varia TaxID=561572 RepID=UPI001CB67ED0|nr:putative mediator of RNA polymerase II transcription subunit 29 [Frieseomelitta varia]